MGKQIREYDNKKVSDYLKEKPAKIGLFFWHGLGDVVMFLNTYDKIRDLYPDTKIDLILQKGVGQEAICPDAVFVSSEHELDKMSYDYVFHVHFPMCEYDKEIVPKAEKCCTEELGIEPTNGHKKIDIGTESRLVGVNFSATALPLFAGVEAPVANLVWQEITESGLIPIEVMMEHVYHNRRNSQFIFVDSTLRRVKPNIETMVSVIRQCFAFIGTSSGPFHLAMSVLPPNRVAYFERRFKLETVTRLPIKVFDVKYYQEGSVKEWLDTLF